MSEIEDPYDAVEMWRALAEQCAHEPKLRRPRKPTRVIIRDPKNGSIRTFEDRDGKLIEVIVQPSRFTPR